MAGSVESGAGEIAIYLDNTKQGSLQAGAALDAFAGETVASREASDPECDAFWIEMVQDQSRRLLKQVAQQGILRRLEDSDPLRCEIRAAGRKNVMGAFRTSYASRKDTFTWSILIFVLATLILIPFLGFLGGSVFSIFVSSLWTALHLVRRV